MQPHSAFLMPNPVTKTIQPHADRNTSNEATCSRPGEGQAVTPPSTHPLLDSDVAS